MLIKERPEDVYLFRCTDYHPAGLDTVLDEMLTGLCGTGDVRGSTILLKPNLISSRGPALACTHKGFAGAVVRWFVDRGAKVKVGDSPAFGSVESVLRQQGILQELEKYSVEIVNFRSIRQVELDNGVTVQLAAEATECDLLVNLPKLKAHNQMFVTCAVKNFFGTVVGMRKALMHMTHGANHAMFADILVRLPSFFPGSLSLVDGIEAMHKSGPLDGEPINLGVVGGSRCPVALDTALLAVLGLQAERSPLWLAAKRADHPGWRAERLCYPGCQPAELATGAFVAPEGLNPIRFNPLRFLVNNFKRIVLASRQ